MLNPMAAKAAGKGSVNDQVAPQNLARIGTVGQTQAEKLGQKDAQNVLQINANTPTHVSTPEQNVEQNTS